MRAALVAVLLTLAGPAAAQVMDSSHVRPGGDLVLEQSIVVPAAPARVWEAFTTSEGFASWAAPVARVDFRLGGLIETTYDPDAAIGSEGTIANEILAYVPERMLAFRNVRTPPGVPFDGAVFRKLHTVVLLEPVAGGRTKVTIVQPGHGSEGAAKGVYDFFAAGNRFSLEKLKERFDKGPVDWRATSQDIQSLQKEGR